MMIPKLVTIILWAFCMGLAAGFGAQRRGIVLRAGWWCWTATAILCALAVGTAYVKFSLGVALVALAVAAVVDAETGYIFDPIVAVGAIGVLIVAALEGAGATSFLGAVLTTGVVFCIWALTFGRGIGLGDVKLAAVVGAAFGPLAGIVVIGLAFIVGAALAIARIVAGKGHFGTSTRFAPYLLAGSVCFLAYHRLSNGVSP